MFRPLVRRSTNRTWLRVSLTGGSAPVLHTPDGPVTSPDEILHVSEEESPRVINCVPLQVRLGVNMTLVDGRLDGITIKMRPAALVVVPPCVQDMFTGIDVGGGADEADEPASKRQCTE
jgi:hypothetical protein